jgi:hypothetical protein
MRPTIRCLLLVMLPATVLAQGRGSGSVHGSVKDQVSGKAVVGAEVTLLDERRSVRTDSIGRFAFREVSPGVIRIRVRAVGFPAELMVFELGEGQAAERPILLAATARTLALVDVREAAPVTDYRMVGFERRRHSGRGQYLTEADLQRLGASDIANALKGLRGVNFECGDTPNGDSFGRGGCFVRMARAPMRCLPEYVVDDVSRNDFGRLTPISDVIGIEVYTGPSDVPGEYAGRNAGCGVIVIWTRSGPARRRQ